MADEFGKSVEFPQVSEFAGASENYIDSPEFPACPDEFAFPGTTDTSDKRSRGKMGLLYYAAVASALFMVVNVTNGFNNPYIDNVNNTDPVPQQTENIVVPGDVHDIDGEEGDPFINITMAKTDGTTLYYSYICALGKNMQPVSVHAAAFDANGREANPADDPDVWTGSRNLFEYTMDVSALQGDLTLVLTGTFERDGEQHQIVKTCKVDDMNIMPETTSYLISADPSGDVTSIVYSAYFIINENDPHMREYDLEVTRFYLEWFDNDKQYIGGGISVWEDRVPEMSMIASAPGYLFDYDGFAHTDNAPDNAGYFSVNMILTDKSTGKQYDFKGEPELLASAEPDVDLTDLFAQHPDWKNEKTGDYYHFGTTQGFRVHNIGGSILFYRFTWSHDSGRVINITESYHQSDASYYTPYECLISGSEDSGYTIANKDSSDADDFYAPVGSVDYEGYAYMTGICDLDTCATLQELNMFMTMFEVQNAKFEISEVGFVSADHGKLVFYGDAGASWWPYDAGFTYRTNDPNNSLDSMLQFELDGKINTSASSTTSGTIMAYIEYYGEGPMLVVNDFGPITHKTMLNWLGDVNKPNKVTARTIMVMDKDGYGSSMNIGPDDDPMEAAKSFASSAIKGKWTNIELIDQDKYLEFPNPNSSTQDPEVNNYHEEYFFRAT